jgi:hypothetical protein
VSSCDTAETIGQIYEKESVKRKIIIRKGILALVAGERVQMSTLGLILDQRGRLRDGTMPSTVAFTRGTLLDVQNRYPFLGHNFQRGNLEVASLSAESETVKALNSAS